MGKKKEGPPIAVGVELIQDISKISGPIEGFLRRHRHRVKTLLSDGRRTDTYVADYMDRDPALRDAVAIVPYARVHTSARPGDTRIILRRQVRYGAFVATGTALVTEVLAGLIEQPERPEETAVREVYEEASLEVELSAVHTLGLPFFVIPGISTERIHPVAVTLTEDALAEALACEPPGDGSPFEEGAEILSLSLHEALRAIAGVRSGAVPEIGDAKTEIALRRLHDALEEGRL